MDNNRTKVYTMMYKYSTSHRCIIYILTLRELDRHRIQTWGWGAVVWMVPLSPWVVPSLYERENLWSKVIWTFDVWLYAWLTQAKENVERNNTYLFVNYDFLYGFNFFFFHYLTTRQRLVRVVAQKLCPKTFSYPISQFMAIVLVLAKP